LVGEKSLIGIYWALVGAIKVILFYLRTQLPNTSHAEESLIKCKTLRVPQESVGKREGERKRERERSE